MPTFARNTWSFGQYHDYYIAGNACNAFCVGEVGSTDDFFLVGCEPNPESNFPLLTGNILGSDGRPLLRLVRNILTINPENCSKIVGDRLGYEIHDGDGQKVISVVTRWQPHSWHPDSKLVTTLFGNFYDKTGRLVFRANSGEEDERIETDTMYACGFTGFGFNVYFYDEERLPFLQHIMHSRGAIHATLARSN